MSDEQDSNNESNNDEPLKNLKSEFSRKFDNQREELTKLAQTNEQLLLAVQQLANQRVQTDETHSKSKNEDLSDLMYTDPEAYAEKIAERVAARVGKAVDSKLNNKDQQAQMIAQLTSEYPELLDTNHEMTKEAVKIYSSMPVKDQESPGAYKSAILEAAANNGILPKSKRVAPTEDFSLSSRTGKFNSSNRSRGKGKLDRGTVEFAREMGFDVNDQKFLDRLRHHSTKNFGEWS